MMPSVPATPPPPVPWLEITPEGVHKSPRQLRQRVEEVWGNVAKVRFIVGSNLRLEAFGTSLGRLWAVVEPALQALVYYVLIRIIAGIRGDAVSFFFIFSAITFWRSHANLLGSSPSLILSRGQEILQTNMSLQILYLEFIGTEFALLLLRIAVLLSFLMAGGIGPGPTWLLAIPIGIVQFLFSSALASWLSLAGAFVKDIAKFLYVFVTLWWYLSPGMYSVERIPHHLRFIYYLNPFAHIFPAIRDSLVDKVAPPVMPLLILAAISMISLTFSSRAVNRSRRFFLTAH
jgi:lipopolysaccharide transport system permease protein